ncbi:MAG: AI-2E family transporter [Acidimicrobiia bacterium]|nr:AI-2E family transporter [Acidimicrobiia bacterium]
MSDPDLSGLVRRVGIFSWSMIGVLALIVATFYILNEGRIILAPLFLALVVIVILNPLVTWMQDRGIPRIIGTLLAFIVFIAAVVLVAVAVLPSVVEQAQGLVETFPELYDDMTQDAVDVLNSLGFENVTIWNYDQIVDYLNDPENRDTIVTIALDRLGSVTAGIFEFILVFLVGPVLAFYFLIDLPNVQKRLLGTFPEEKRAEAAHVGGQLNTALGGFLRGQLLVAVIVGVMLSFGYWLIGLDFWLLIGLIGGLLNIVPFLGPWVGGALGVIVALTTADLGTALWAIVVAVIVQQIDNNFVSPTVLRATVQLHPAVILLVLILAGAIAGVWGVIIAVPLTASVRILLGHWWRTRVLGQTWEEASEAMFQEPEPGRLRRTGEMPAVTAEGEQEQDPD